MNCTEFSNLLDAFMDGSLSDAEANRMREHAKECAGCASLLALRLDERRMDEEIEVPDGFSSSWRQKIQEEREMEEKQSKTAKNRHWKAWLATAAALAFILGGTIVNRDSYPRTADSTARNAAGESKSAVSYSAKAPALGASKRYADNGADSAYLEGAMEMPMAEPAVEYEAYYSDESAEAETEDNGAGKAEKNIRTASFTIKTTEYDLDLEKLKALANSLGGRVEYLSSYGDASSSQNRSASLTLRIPSNQLDAFLEGAQSIGTVTAMTQEMEDVSDSYYDVRTRLDTQKTKMDRLQALLRDGQDLSDLIELEDAIAETQYYIDRYTAQLQSYDSKVDYSTVRVSVRETRVIEMENLSLGQRVLSGLRGSLEQGRYFLEDMVIFLVSALPWLLAGGIVVLIVVLIVRKKRKG